MRLIGLKFDQQFLNKRQLVGSGQVDGSGKVSSVRHRSLIKSRDQPVADSFVAQTVFDTLSSQDSGF